MVSQNGIKLAAHFITNHFGTTVAKVCENLLRKGPLPLELLIRYTELNHKDVKNSLLVLIQHNCVQPFVYLGGDDDNGSKVGIQYLALFDNIIHRLRFPKFVDIVSRELDKKCVYLLEGLLRDGRLTLKQMIDRASQGKENSVATDVRESLRKLLNARYVERCPAREVGVSTDSTEETTTRKRGAKAAKVFVAPKTLEQRVIEAAVPKEVIRFSLTADTGCNADRETNSDDSKMISVEVDVEEEHTLWRANFEEFIRYLRHKALIENVRARMDDGAATVLSAILEAKKTAEEKVKMEYSVPLSMDIIYDEVIKTGNGRTMTMERVKDYLHQLGYPKSMVLDDHCRIDLKGIIQWARNEEVESIVLKRYGMDAYRMFRHLSKEDMFCPTDKIAESILLEKKEAPRLLNKLWTDNYLYMERVTVPGSRQSQISVWKVNKPQIWGLVLDEMFKAALNLSLRMAYEQERGEGVINVHQDKFKGTQLQSYKRLKNGLLLLGSSLMKLDDALMLFHDF
ncbi:uncharacterized protein LOC130716999 isoform X2 [Lotus japonicus]|uniref:uncharacterized protein LOC130716999 isoform X2 n=1 Tax=Lotus japonicus TaxID=34305 RepID=UPI00258B0A80|nr:uncharacterized protein LOC130716999 isoform X2 [Lotus japonicus]